MKPEHPSQPPEEPIYDRLNAVDFSPWSEAKNEYRETLPQHEIAFAFIKPGFEDRIDDMTGIMQENGLDVIYSDQVQLTPEAVDYMYRDVVDKHFYPTMKSYLTSHAVTMLLVGGQGHEAVETLSGLKKTKDGEDGLIRQLFKHDNIIPDEDYEKWSQGVHPDQDDITILLAQGNVFHTADSPEEAIESLKMILGDKFHELRVRGALPSELWDFFKENPTEEKT